jgi:hypothetical protein
MSGVLAVAALALTATCCSGNPVMVLDDLDSEEVFSNTRAHQGSYAPCLQDAYKGQFVHDWARDKGQVSATYSFDPPKDGCYLVEEHHPGRDYACSRYLPQAAKLEVGYCMGKTSQLSIDQSRNGGKWNPVGRWPFFKGHKGSFKMSNSQEDSCSTGNCFWVADAFRVTWIGRTCKERDVAAAQAEEAAAQPDEDVVAKVNAAEDGSQEQATVDNMKASTAENSEEEQATSGDMASTETQGTISMFVTSSGDHADLKLKMENSGVIEMALKAHFGYKSVNVLSLDITSARRLGQPPASSLASDYRIDATFAGQGGQQISNDLTLMDQLQNSLDAKEAGIQVKSVTVSFDSPQTGQPVDVSDKDPEEPTNTGLIIAVGVGLVAGSFALLMILRTMKKLADKKKAEQIAKESGDIFMYSENAKDPEKAVESKDVKKEEDIDVVSVSTAPPDSDGCSETGSGNQAAVNNSETRSNLSQTL